ncbi:hypothetical protein CEXT_273821 [Caerostris extrusa]|uniref:Uncharacterized protein n=1 Tax=Caerostris extrusa TaxID=172846 RepID=A0AAV4QI92_CAEEX|nr:hypothetical protein CEXT_273821 [Caerostris extrusa]
MYALGISMINLKDKMFSVGYLGEVVKPSNGSQGVVWPNFIYIILKTFNGHLGDNDAYMVWFNNSNSNGQHSNHQEICGPLLDIT